MKVLSLEETIKSYTNENGFAWGINTVMKSLAQNINYNLICSGGFFIDKWESDSQKPTSQEIRDEYIRQQTIAEFIDYLKSKNFDINKITS